MLAHSQQYQNGMTVPTCAKGGHMYEASLGGQKFKIEPLAEK